MDDKLSVVYVSVLSGGMDSSTATYAAANDLVANYNGGTLACLSFDYGQKHGDREIEAAAYVVGQLRQKFNGVLNIIHRVIDVTNMRKHLISALTHDDIDVPEGHYTDNSMKATVVPNRNSIMLNLAAGVAVSYKASRMWTGVHAGDHPIYPDCRPAFITALNHLLQVANEGFIDPDFRVVAPYMHSTKTDIVVEGVNMGVPFHLTYSCYNGRTHHCGACATCVERRLAFMEAAKLYHELEIRDPTSYEYSLISREFLKGAAMEMEEKELWNSPIVLAQYDDPQMVRQLAIEGGYLS